MKKLFIIAVAMLLIVPVMAMAGMTAFDNMTELGPEMAEITGQVGISIDSDMSSITVGYLAWTDSDGFGTTVTQNQGALTLSNIQNTMTITGLKIDAGSDATTSYLAITLPSTTGDVTIAAVKIGTGPNQGGSLGAITLGNVVNTGSTIKIYAH